MTGKGRDARPLDEVAADALRDYACERVDLALRLQAQFTDDLARYELTSLFRDMEMRLLPVLAAMEWAGVRIDGEFFARMSDRLTTELRLTTEEIFKIAGEEFNISSTPQLRAILFDKLGLPVLRKTKTGASTDASVLEELAAQGPAIP